MVAKIREIQQFLEALHVTSLVPKGFKFPHGGKTIFWKSCQWMNMYFFHFYTEIQDLAPINAFLHYICRNSRWLPKLAGKQFLGKVISRL